MPSGTGVPTAIDRIARKCKVQPDLVEDAYPCTSLQAGLVAADLQGLGDYVSRFVFDLSKLHEQHAVRAGFENVYGQNPILRTRIIENGGQFLQVVINDELHWQTADNLQVYLARDRQRNTTFGGPLAKFAWIEQNDGAVYMVWSLHHCQYDEWSFRLLLTDLNLSTSKDEALDNRGRTPLAKFVKGLDKIDDAASRDFWKETMQSVSNSRPICHDATEETTFRTSKQCEKRYVINIPVDSTYQPSVLAVAAWSLLVGRLSGSANVLFGHVLSGRAFDLEGIQEVCGPTLTTVPWPNSVPYDDKVDVYLGYLQDLRTRILPFEQTGLTEYRRLVGTASFDTLLSVRSSQDQSDESDVTQGIQPQRPDVTDLNHPCCVFFEVEIADDKCLLKASYDVRWVDPTLLEYAMDKFVKAVETLPKNLDANLKSFEESLGLPKSIQATNPREKLQDPGVEIDQALSELDPKVMTKVQKLAMDIAGVKAEATSAGPDTTLMQLGMDSLKTVVLSRHLNKVFSTSLPFKDIAGPGRSIASICRAIERASKGSQNSAESATNLSLLDMADKHMGIIRIAAPSPTEQAKATGERTSAMLLTGATGYLGIEILRQCLHTTTEKIVVLVRCGSASEGMNRVHDAAKMAAWDAAEIYQLRNRAVCWPSDLSKEHLGLKQEHWQVLTGQSSDHAYNLKTIIHNGAKVDFLHSYTDLEDANVRSTAILLDIQATYEMKPSFVFVTGGRPCPLQADDVDRTAAELAQAPGYAQTKFVSEVLVHKTAKSYKQQGQAASMSIVHPGAIIGRMGNGVANIDDFVWRYVAASQRMGSYVPAVPTKREWINLTPVDNVAAVVVSQALQQSDEKAGPRSSVVRCLMRKGLPISQFWAVVAGVLRENHISLKAVSEWEWLRIFETDLERRGEEQPLFSLSQLLLQGNIKGIGGIPPQIDIRSGRLPNTKSVVDALRSNVEYLVSNGFFSNEKSAVPMFGRSKA